MKSIRNILGGAYYSQLQFRYHYSYSTGPIHAEIIWKQKRKINRLLMRLEEDVKKDEGKYEIN